MRVLQIVHGLPPASAGGTEVYVEALAGALRRAGDDVFVLAREAAPARPDLAVRREDRGGLRVTHVNNTFRRSRAFEATYRDEAIRRLGARLLDEVEPEVAHVHHLSGLSTDLVGECARRGIPTVLTLHDYWLLCHRGQLLDLDLRRCEGPEGPGGCARCLGAPGGAPAGLHRLAPIARALERRAPAAAGRLLRRLAASAAGAVADPATAAREAERRLRHMREVCGLVTVFLALSRSIRARFVAFGVEEDRIQLHEPGIDLAPFRHLERRGRDRLLRLGFLGGLVVSKAPHVLLEAFAGLPPGSASLTLWGAHAPYHGDDGYRGRLAPLLGQPGVRHAGPVPHDRVPGVLASLDVLVVPSIWPENAPLVVREAFAAGVPVVASRLGGLAETVVHERNGLLVEPGDAADLGRALRRLLDEPALLPRLRAGIPAVRSIEEDADRTRALYRTLRPAARDAVGPSRPAPRVAAVVVNYRTAEDTLLAARALGGSRRPIQDLVVVDNGSGDGSPVYLAAHLPGATVVETGENLGFSGGSNAGIRRALERGADLVLLVNSDAILPPDGLGRLEEALARRPDAGIAGPIILSRSEPERVLSAGIAFSPRTGRVREFGYGRPLAALAPVRDRVVDAVSGAVMLVRRELLERVGLLGEEYFFSFEDLDLCLRARRAGFVTVCAGDAVAYHEGSRSIGARSPRRLYFATRNHLLLARRAAPAAGPARGLLRAGSIVALSLAHALLRADVPRLRGLGGVARGAWHHARRRYGPL